jgi:hypothetical protein
VWCNGCDIFISAEAWPSTAQPMCAANPGSIGKDGVQRAGMGWSKRGKEIAVIILLVGSEGPASMVSALLGSGVKCTEAFYVLRRPMRGLAMSLSSASSSCIGGPETWDLMYSDPVMGINGKGAPGTRRGNLVRCTTLPESFETGR